MTYDKRDDRSRREVLAAASVLLGGLVAGACGDDEAPERRKRDAGPEEGDSGSQPEPAADSGSSSGSGSEPKPEAGSGGKPAAGSGGSPAAAAADPDITPLNALLGAEYNAITAYAAGAGLIMKAPEKDPLYALRMLIVEIALDFRAQHKLHAAALVEAIESLKGKPVAESEIAAVFKPPAALVANPSIANVLKFAAGAERGAAVAYNQVLGGMEDARFRFLASSIEGDESQHFIVLLALVLGIAAPGPNLRAQTADDVVPEAFVTSIGDRRGLDKAPPDYFG
jgi:hypothetical protein